MEADHELAALIAENVRKHMEQQGLTQVALSGKSGIDTSQISLFLKHKKPISLGTIAAYADALGVHPATLLGAVGGKPLVSGKLPHYGEVPCGTPVSVDSPHPELDDTIAKLIRGEGRFSVTARGESMTGRGIMDGDRIIGQKQKTANNGQLVIATVDEKATIKVFRLNGKEIWLHPASDNPDHKPIKFDPSTCEIHGIVVGIVRKL